MKGRTLVLVAVLFVAIVAAIGYMVISRSPADVNKTIIDSLAGTNLTYYSIAGKPMNYTITPGDIVSIEPVSYEGRPAWKVRVGRGLAWDLTMDAKGTEVLKTEQLFVT